MPLKWRLQNHEVRLRGLRPTHRGVSITVAAAVAFFVTRRHVRVESAKADCVPL
jgi:hypothetical protein